VLAFKSSEIFGVIVVEKHPWNLLLGKEGSKPTGVYWGSKIRGKIFLPYGYSCLCDI